MNLLTLGRQLICWFRGHQWDTLTNADYSTEAVCRRKCGAARPPLRREDGCTPVWDAPDNAYRCLLSSNRTARAWGGLCPAHQAMAAADDWERALAPTLRARHIPISWMTVPHPQFGGMTPWEVCQGGQHVEIVKLLEKAPVYLACWPKRSCGTQDSPSGATS